MAALSELKAASQALHVIIYVLGVYVYGVDLILRYVYT